MTIASIEENPDSQSVLTLLEQEIRSLAQEPFAPEHWQRLLVRLVAAPGDPKRWAAAMDALMEHWTFGEEAGQFIRSHAKIAQLLKPTASKQLYHFCNYLALRQLSHHAVWVGYRVLEHYLDLLSAEDVKRVLTIYLTHQAKRHIQEKTIPCYMSNRRKLYLQEISIDAGAWFGLDDGALWEQDSTLKPMLDVLCAHILRLRGARRDRPFVVGMPVGMSGAGASTPPPHFMLALAQQITEECIFFLDHDAAIDPQILKKPEYALRKNLTFFGPMLESLIRKYPQAVATVHESEELARQHPNAVWLWT